MKNNVFAIILTSGLLAACGSEQSPGTLTVSIYGEEFVEEGIPAAEFVDGWAVSFTSLSATLTDVSAAAGDDAAALTFDGPTVYELTTASSGAGQVVVTGEVDGGAYDEVSYRISQMVVEGTATKGGQTKTFSWMIQTPTTYGACEGTAVIDGNDATTTLTVHADHFFYDDLVDSEPNVAFDLIASADDNGDGDGDITQAELEAVDITGESRYQVGNQTEVVNLWQFIDRQSSTVGHIDGEGHCGDVKRQ